MLIAFFAMAPSETPKYSSTLDLAELSGHLFCALSKYENHFDGKLKFSLPGPFDRPFELTPDKPYSARTDVPVTFEGKDIGDMCVIAFKPEDGTGNENDYALDELAFHEKYFDSLNPGKVVPRKKDSVLYELFFPIFSISERAPYYLLNSLEELTFEDNDPTIITKAWDLGTRPGFYKRLMKYGGEDIKPVIQFTTGYKPNRQRFGDPHSVFHVNLMDAVQVAGFLSIPEGKDVPGLCDIAKTPY